MITAILFDFFGTLVDYRPSVEGEGFRESFRHFQYIGGRGDYAEFLTGWETNGAAFEAEANRTHIEYSLEGLVSHFFRSQGIAEHHGGRFIETFIGEWNGSVTFDPHVVSAVRTLAKAYRVGVVTNTNLTWLVPGHILRMGLRDVFPAITTSIEVGRRKPHPQIFETALARLDVGANETLFVGDSIAADFEGAHGAGLQALLVDRHGLSGLPANQRIATVAHLPEWLASAR